MKDAKQTKPQPLWLSLILAMVGYTMLIALGLILFKKQMFMPITLPTDPPVTIALVHLLALVLEPLCVLIGGAILATEILDGIDYILRRLGGSKK